MKKRIETTAEKVARLRRKRRVLEQDRRFFGYYPDLDEEEENELKWLAEYEEAAEAREDEIYEEKRHGLF